MTTKAFLKTAEKKRDSSQAKESTPLTPVDARPAPTPAVPDDKPPVEDASAEAVTADVAQETQHEGEQHQTGGSPDKQHAALDTTGADAEHTNAAEVEVCAIHGFPLILSVLTPLQNELSGEQVPGEAENPEDHQAEEQNESNEDKGDEEAAPGEADGDENNKDNSQQNPSFPNGLGFGGGMNGSFPNMNFGGDYNQMQMMMAMQNGMAPNFGAFPMMGKQIVSPLTQRLRLTKPTRNAGNGHGPFDDEHVPDEQWLRTRHGHEHDERRHGRVQW